MAVATSALIAGGIGAATGGFQLFQGIKQSKEAKEALANFERQDLTNVYENQGISTIGSDLMREEAGRTSASLVDATRNAGIRGVFGGIPKIAAQNNSQNRNAQLYLDNQVQDRNRLIAGDNQRIQAMQEARDNQELAGIGALKQAGQENTFSGIRGIGNAGALMGMNLESQEGKPDLRSPLDTIKALTPSNNFYTPSLGSSFGLPSDMSSLAKYQQMKAEEEQLRAYSTRNYV